MFDVKKILEEKNPVLAEKIPYLGYYALKRVVHEPLVRSFLEVHGNKNANDFTAAALSHLGIQVDVLGQENLKKDNPSIICANHPCGGPEGLGLIHTIIEKLGTCRIPANDILGRIKPLKPLLVPVDKKRPTKESLEYLQRVFAGAEPVLIFPAGVTARKKAGVLREFPWQPSFVTHARRSNRTIVPVWVSGENSAHFYLIHRLRTLFGISFNLEMALLADELLRRRNTPLVIQFLPPVSPVLPPSWKGSPKQWDTFLARNIQNKVEQFGWRYTHG